MKGLSDFINDSSTEIYVNEVDNSVIINGKKIDSPFLNPKSAIIYKDRIYITDSYNNVVKIFSVKGEFIKEFGKTELQEPYGISNLKDNIYVVSRNDGRIYVYDINGEFKKVFGKKMKFPSVIKIRDERIYVCATNENAIYVYSLTGEIVNKIESKFDYPLGIEITENFLYVADQYNKRVVKLSKDGIYISDILKGDYYSIIKIKGEKLKAYDEKSGKFLEKEISEEKLDICNYLREKGRLKELAYYYIRKDKFKEAKDILNDNKHWDKNYKKENLIIAKELNNQDFYEFLIKNYDKKESFLNKLESSEVREKYNFILKKVIGDFPKLRLQKPKAIYKYKDELWISMFKARLLLKINKEFALEEIDKINNQVDKFIVTNREIIIVDYYYRKVLALDREDLNQKREISKDFKNPVDLIRVKNDMVILDSVLNKVFIYKLRGKKQNEYNIEGKEVVAIYYRGDRYYILDKKDSIIRIYNSYFELLEKIKIKQLKYPDDLVVDKIGNIYISDEGNDRVVKVDKKGEIIFEEDSFLKPRDIILDDKNIYISDFGFNKVKLYSIGGE